MFHDLKQLATNFAVSSKDVRLQGSSFDVSESAVVLGKAKATNMLALPSRCQDGAGWRDNFKLSLLGIIKGGVF